MILCGPPEEKKTQRKQEGGLGVVPPVMHARSCLSASAALPTARGERKKNADHGIKTKLEEGAGKTGNRKPLAAPVNTSSANCI